MLTLFDSLNVLLYEIRRFMSKEVKKKRLQRNEFVKLRDTLNVSPNFLWKMMISFFQARTNIPYIHVENFYKVEK